MKVKLLFFSVALVYTVLILYLSLINPADANVRDLWVSDKAMHAGAYFGLVLLWSLYCIFFFEEGKFLSRIIIISFASTAFGIFIEVLQDVLTSYRQLDFYDVLANTTGVVVAGVGVWISKVYLIRVKAKIARLI